MRFFVIILATFAVFSGCYKLKSGYRDTKFRNKFVGTYRIDSIVNHHLHISDSGVIGDTNYTVCGMLGDYLEILPTKDQVEKNLTCSGKFLDSVFRYEVQGFNDKNAERLSFTYCNDCSYSPVFSTYILGSRYIVAYYNNVLILESRFSANGIPFYTRHYLTKK